MSRFEVLRPPPEDLARKLLRDFPFKGYQFRQLGLEPEELVTHHLKRLMDPATDASFFTGDKSHGLISFRENTLLGPYVGAKATRIDNFLRSDYEDAALVQALTRYLLDRDESKGFCEAWLPLDDIVGTVALLRAGFHQVGVELRFGRQLSQEYRPEYPAKLDIRPYEPRWEEELRSLCARFHEKNRFGCDPLMDSETRSRIYVDELSQLLKSRNLQCFTFWQDGKLIGFNTAKINVSLTQITGRGYGSLDLIVLDPEARRKGGGVELSLSTLEWLRDQNVTFVGCRTMASNYPAIALLQTLGFRIVFAKVILHRWGHRPDQLH